MARLLGTALVLLLLLPPLAFFLYKYLPYYLHTIKSESPRQIVLDPTNVSTIASQRLRYLQELTSLPLVGQFFQEDKIFELVRLNRFQQVIEKSGLAIGTVLNAHSAQIWYYRALSQCLLGHIEDCETSLNQATLYANRYTEKVLEGVYTILEQMIASERQTLKGEHIGSRGKKDNAEGRRMADFSEL